jgi:hypothetical protein
MRGEFLVGGSHDGAVDAGVEEVAGQFEADHVAQDVVGWRIPRPGLV